MWLSSIPYTAKLKLKEQLNIYVLDLLKVNKKKTSVYHCFYFLKLI